MSAAHIPEPSAQESLDQIEDNKRCLLWAGDYHSGVIAPVMASLGVRTYGDLAVLSTADLLHAGLLQDEITQVRSILARKSLSLSVRNLR